MTASQRRNINAAIEMRLLSVVTGFFPLLDCVATTSPLQLDLDSWCDDGPGDFASVLLPDLGELLLDELVEYPVFLADIMSHDGLHRENL